MINILCLSPGKKILFDNISVEFMPAPNTLIKRINSMTDLDKLYRTKDPEYINYQNNVLNILQYYNILYSDQCSLIHPEIISNINQKGLVKLLTAVDDPITTYSKTIPSAWAYDGTVYVSPSYDNNFTMRELLERSTFKPSFFLPHCRITNLAEQSGDLSLGMSIGLNNRKSTSYYVGGYYEEKADRLAELKKELKNDFQIYGDWPYKGFRGYIRGFTNKPYINQVVTSVTENEYRDIAIKSKVCINLHYNLDRETGNQRLYQAISYGNLVISDGGYKNSINDIFEDEKEILIYRNIKEAVDLTRQVKNNPAEFEHIRISGIKKLTQNYLNANFYNSLVDIYEKIRNCN